MQIQHLFANVHLCRLDELGGNKPFKLKYNIIHYLRNDYDQLITFGGAHSNHLRAVADVTYKHQIPLLAVVRGERNNSLLFEHLEGCGAKLLFVSRSEYKTFRETDYEVWRKEFPKSYILPEGGANAMAVQGASEIGLLVRKSIFPEPTYVCVPAGTGATATGLLNFFWESPTKIVVYSALKGGDFLREAIFTQLRTLRPTATVEQLNKRLLLKTDFHFGGFAKSNPTLRNFMLSFERDYHVALDQVYTAKMLFGIFQEQAFYTTDNKCVLVFHTYNP